MPHLMQDPYPQIKSFIERELDHVAKLQTDLFSGRQSATAELDSALCSVDEQLSALERAVSSMVANPSKFNLSTNTAYQRQVEVENLRFQMSDWRRTCDQVKASSSKPSYTEIELGAQGANGYHKKANGMRLPVSSSSHHSSSYDDDIGTYQQAVQQAIKQQDNDLAEISIHVDNIKQTGYMMHDELEEQEFLLSDLQDHVDTSNLKIRGLRKRVTDILQRSRGDKQLWLIAFLSVVLVILTVIAFV
eukprot:jgi/Chrzof1/2776/Cz11g29010.t1